MYAHPRAIAEVRRRVEAIIAAEGDVTVARLRDELATSRKYAQALLEHLDAARVTLRSERRTFGVRTGGLGRDGLPRVDLLKQRCGGRA
jgi:Elongation factor SelB, winged helix